jgi:serine/threonine protein kinase
MESPQKLASLFHEAIALDPQQRAELIARTREADPELADEVESLIAAHEKSGSFLDTPAIEANPSLVAESRPALTPGQLVGRYQIVKPLGKGGMGEVYLANDPKLDRQVALKLLPAIYTDSKERLRRFVQEAKAASSLNHPNIITIHEIGEADGAHFIATELIHGLTLKQHIAQGPMKLSDVLDIAIQTANALQSAHAAGIVHRDIKPENIMVRPDGYVKVLDFGLAKLTEKAGQSRSAASNIDTMVKAHTNPGTVLGTVKYMSPEQARGQVLDERTDIFSLGIVVYEMAAGHLPFAGETSMDTLVSILEKEPAPLEENAPVELQRIVSKALRKDREERYQTIKDFLIDLKSLKEDLSFQQKLDRSRPARSKVEAAPELKATPSQPRQKRSKAVIAVLIFSAIVELAVMAAVIWRRKSSPPEPAVATPVAAPVVPQVPQRTIKYWITVQKYRDGKPYQDPFRLSDDINFEKDYRIRLTITSPQAGQLYLLNEGPVGIDQAPAFNVLYPNESVKGLAALKENQEMERWFQFDEQQGTEKLWLVWSEKEVPELEAVKGFANPKDRGVIGSPGLRTAVAQFLKNNSLAPAVVERDQEKKETLLKANGQLLVHIIKLEHH